VKRPAVFLLLVVLLAFPQPAMADIAPPIYPPGANPQPGAESTAVEMRHETVLIEVKDGGVNKLGVARVTADFTMHNPSSQAETLAVRFPISANDGRAQDGRMQYPEISSISIQVNGRPLNYTRLSYPSLGWDDAEVPWAEFTVNFPAGADTAIRVSYDLQGSGYFPYTAFYYILHTGAGWAGDIGRAEISLRLPYLASPQNVVLNSQIGWAETTAGGVFAGNELRWIFEDFEPGDGSLVRDMEFALVAPSAWKALLGAQAEVKARPRDGEAWGRLGKRYKDLFLQSKGYRADPGGLELYELSVQAYEECLKLKPDDAQWHAGFAELLANRAYWDSWSGDPVPESFRALEELHTALQLAPRDSVVLAIAENISWLLEGGIVAGETGYDFPWLTQTPTPLPPTATLAPSFDPFGLAGTYTSGQITREDGKGVLLTLEISGDHTAALQTALAGEPARTDRATWTDLGDGSFRLVVALANGETQSYVFRVQPDRLIALEFPPGYGESGLELARAGSFEQPPPTPGPSATPGATWTPMSPQEVVIVPTLKTVAGVQATATPPGENLPPITPTPAGDAGAGDTADGGGVCGSVLLILLPLLIVVKRVIR